MIVFIDESGDAGMKDKSGSSDLFVMVAVVFYDHEEAAKCDTCIAQLRRTLTKNQSGNKEYKFNKCDRKEREAFFKGIAQFKFNYVAIVINKSALYGPGFQFKSPFYKFTAKLLFDNAKQYLSEAIVVLDGCGDREFRQQLETYVKRNVNAKGQNDIIAKLKLEASHSNNLLQLADMIVGAVARSLRSDKKDAPVYRGMIYRKELLVKVWPKK
ncbi:MAG TPA: DUF3800 domain-containing protein [Candidatus Angelobacter sp.]|nr:DUF3800 domain-containing protein [Candidatus Angelobacter sp.]